jgi:hypothetical protein
MLTIATYWWHDDKFPNRYTADDVRALQRAALRNLTVPHEFTVITDCPKDFDGDDSIRAIPIDWTKHVTGTCFVRLMTFHPDGAKMIGERVLILDLDTFITGSLDSIVSRTDDLVLWRNPARLPWANPTKTSRPFYNASVQLHRCGTMPQIWTEFDPLNPTVRDDQWWMAKVLGPDVPYFDGEHDGVYRLARADTPGSGVWGEKLPENARIVTFPGSDGKPDRPEIRAANPWIAEYERERLA